MELVQLRWELDTGFPIEYCTRTKLDMMEELSHLFEKGCQEMVDNFEKMLKLDGTAEESVMDLGRSGKY
jgi:hypothetical protein